MLHAVSGIWDSLFRLLQTFIAGEIRGSFYCPRENQTVPNCIPNARCCLADEVNAAVSHSSHVLQKKNANRAYYSLVLGEFCAVSLYLR